MNLRTLIVSVALALALTDEASASDEPPSTTWPAPPFEAWVAADDDVFVMPRIGRYGPSIAILKYGDVVRVTRCEPACDAPYAWAELAPFGAVRINTLRVTPRDRRGEFLAGAPSFTWARVGRAGAVARSAPSADADVVERFRRDDELVFRRDPMLLASGWLERPGGGFVPASALTVFSASSFRGWQNPPNQFAFVRVDTELTRPDGSTVPAMRYERFEVVGLTRDAVITPSGNLPRANVRVGQAVLRNMRVPVGARWVHVDLEQQILTAYEGERLVFATLVSTGRREGSTRTGVFEVRRKITYTQMRGGGASPYSVEGVPYVLYFDGAVALHGAFWHDGFGQRRSHGCVNLAPADAQFIFDFAPPELPTGWRSVNPIALGLDSLWVEVS